MPSQPQQGKVKISELQVNPEYEHLLPQLADEDYKNLETSILKDGVLHPFLINPDKVILDGYHRLKICKLHSIAEVLFTERSFATPLAEKEFVISFNLNRRHLTTTQKVELSIEILKIEMEKAKQRQIAQLKQFREENTVPPILGEREEDLGETIEIAAEKDPEVYFDRIFENGKKTYCKYCYKDVHIAPGDGIWECAECGAGLALLNGGSEERGEAIEIAAKKVGLGRETLRKGQQILEAAKTNEEFYKSWLDLAHGIGSINSVYQDLQAKEEEAHIHVNTHIEGVFQVVVVDPPGFKLESLKRMSIPFDEKGCVLWLWTPLKSFCDAFSLMRHWGFQLQTILTWVKNHKGSGEWLLNQTEHCLLATKGRPRLNLTYQSTVLIASHSSYNPKPDEFFSLASSLTPGARKLSVFYGHIDWHGPLEVFTHGTD